MRYSSIIMTVGIAVMLHACSTAELAVDLAKKYQRNQEYASSGSRTIPAGTN